MAVSDRMLPILTGEITSPDVALIFETGRPSDLFWRALHDGAFDITEMSLAAHAILTSRGENPFAGLPVFTSRMFRHGSIFVSEEAGISRPEDLAGKRVGIPEYQMTAAVWIRGFLMEFYGVTPADIHWFTGGVNRPGRAERIALRAPPSVRVERVAANRTLNELLLAGEIDAIIAPQVPQAFRQGDPRVRRLFPDYRQDEAEYFIHTGIFPIMHLLVMRRELAAKAPELPALLFDLFDRARQRAMETLADADAPYVMLPWQVEEAERTRALMGDDYWLYGLDANRHTIETFLRYLGEQGLLARQVQIEELFAPF